MAALGGIASACLQLGRDQDALNYIEKGFALSDTYPTFFGVKNAALANLGRLDESREVLKKYRALEPDRTPKVLRTTNNYGGSEGGKRYFEALRLAGLSEE